jgi:hypothetical protein
VSKTIYVLNVKALTLACYRLEQVAKSERKYDEHYYRALAYVRQLGREQGIDAALKEHNLDALVAPAYTTVSHPTYMHFALLTWRNLHGWSDYSCCHRCVHIPLFQCEYQTDIRWVLQLGILL